MSLLSLAVAEGTNQHRWRRIDAAGEMGEATVVTTAAAVLLVLYLLAWEDGLAADVPAFFGAVLTLRRNLLILLWQGNREVGFAFAVDSFVAGMK